MFIVANFLLALAQILDLLLWAYMWIVVASAVISWISADPYNPIVRFLRAATEPVLHRVRRALPIHAGGIDFSPIIVFIGIIFLQRFLVASLSDLARSLRVMG